MTARGVVGPVRVSTEAARMVSSLLLDRVLVPQGPLRNLPAFADLPVFYEKLGKSARREGRADPGYATVTTLTREEAAAGFHCLALFVHPAAPAGAMTDAEAAAVNEIAIELARCLTTKAGAARLSRADAEWALDPSGPEGTHKTSRSHKKKLQERLNREDTLNQTPVADLPEAVRKLLLP